MSSGPTASLGSQGEASPHGHPPCPVVPLSLHAHTTVKVSLYPQNSEATWNGPQSLRRRPWVQTWVHPHGNGFQRVLAGPRGPAGLWWLAGLGPHGPQARYLSPSDMTSSQRLHPDCSPPVRQDAPGGSAGPQSCLVHSVHPFLTHTPSREPRTWRTWPGRHPEAGWGPSRQKGFRGGSWEDGAGADQASPGSTSLVP